MEYSITNKRDKENTSEKCPRCLFVGRSFLILSEVLWACLDCGTTFVPKKVRTELRNMIHKKADEIKKEANSQAEELKKTETLLEESPFPCEICGKPFQRELYRINHMKSHIPKVEKMEVMNAYTG